jgi:hypothetical protein
MAAGKADVACWLGRYSRVSVVGGDISRWGSSDNMARCAATWVAGGGEEKGHYNSQIRRARGCRHSREGSRAVRCTAAD